jgi:hypothetical protein
MWHWRMIIMTPMWALKLHQEIQSSSVALKFVVPDTPQLAHFISRTPKLEAHNEAQVINNAVQVLLQLGQCNRSFCEPDANCQIGSFRLRPTSAVLPCLPFPRWNTSTSARVPHVGKTHALYIKWALQSREFSNCSATSAVT